MLMVHSIVAPVLTPSLNQSELHPCHLVSHSPLAVANCHVLGWVHAKKSRLHSVWLWEDLPQVFLTYH